MSKEEMRATARVSASCQQFQKDLGRLSCRNALRQVAIITFTTHWRRTLEGEFKQTVLHTFIVKLKCSM